MNTKTLVIIINHNRKEYTNRLYRSLKPYENSGNYYITVFDNGSTEKHEISEHTKYSMDFNSYYGGALNVIFNKMLELPEYDSVFILNNDLIVHPYNFVSGLRKVMFDMDYKVVTPAIIQPEEVQCFWKQMHNWGSAEPRQVKWVDFVCPLIHRKVIEKINQYSSKLLYGWGQDVYTGVVCEQEGWKTAVLDAATIVHLSSQTLKDGKSNVTLNKYHELAMGAMYSFFEEVGLSHKLNEFRAYGQYYAFNM
jgi:GT2 family glycosyltransferase